MRIIGIDPGTLHLGFGIVDWQAQSNRLDYVSCGTVDMASDLHISQRLKQLQRELETILNKYSPDQLGLENLFFGINVQSAIKIGEARAVVMLTAAQYDIEITELAPTTVKKTVAGNGRASKDQVQKMVTMLLELNQAPSSYDASDALAVAISTAYKLRPESVAEND